MQAGIRQHIENLVEDLRSSGYHGRDSVIAWAPPHVGTRVTAARQLEVIACQIASAWVDLRETDIWDDFIQTGFIPRLLALAEIIDDTIKLSTAELRQSTEGFTMLEVAWDGTRLLIERVKGNAVAVADRSVCIVTLLEAAMVVRQCAEHELMETVMLPIHDNEPQDDRDNLLEIDEILERGEAPDGGAALSAHWGNVSPEFYARCLAELGFPRGGYSIALDNSLEERARLVARASRKLCSNAPSKTRQRSV